MAVLQVLKGLNPGQLFPIEGDRAVLGRHPDCDIVLDVGAVSRQHAQIVRENGQYYVEDLHSRNGTLVNGQPIVGRHPLEENDRVKICDLLFTFHHGEPGSQGTPRRAAIAGGGDVGTLLVEEDESSSSTIMSKLELSTAGTGLRMAVRPEVKLRALVEITQNLGNALSVDVVLPKLLDSLFKIFIQADRGFVALRERPEGPLLLKAVKHRRPEAEEAIRISRTIVNQATNAKEAILSADAATDARFDMSQSIADFRIRSLMCAPLIDSEGHVLGVIQIDTLDERSRFQKDDLDVLASVAQQAASTIENAQLHEAALKQQRLQRDLELAHQVQRGFLPAEPPRVAGYEFFDFYDSAEQLGGDYYDYVELPGGRLAVVLADVAGKGISAALLMAKLSADVRYCLASEPDPAAAIDRLNAAFANSGWQDRFVTCALAVLDLRAHHVTIVNAGHMPPFLRHANRTVEAVGGEQAGIPLGIDADFQYRHVTLTLLPGDSLTLFTDGFSEAMNTQGELFGVERLRAELSAAAGDVGELGRHLLERVRQFVGKQPQSDDMCLACFGRSG